MEDLKIVESVCRKDPKVIEQCRISGIEDMSKVYCDRTAVSSSKVEAPWEVLTLPSLDHWL